MVEEIRYSKRERNVSIKIALELAAQQTPLAKGVDVERFMDSSLLRELEKSDFYKTPTASGK